MRVPDPAGGEDQRAEFPAAQLEAWAAEGLQTDEELHARMLETMRTEIVAEAELEEVMDANESANARSSPPAGGRNQPTAGQRWAGFEARCARTSTSGNGGRWLRCEWRAAGQLIRKR